MVPVNGIGPFSKAYESFVLPLNYTGVVSYSSEFMLLNQTYKSKPAAGRPGSGGKSRAQHVIMYCH